MSMVEPSSAAWFYTRRPCARRSCCLSPQVRPSPTTRPLRACSIRCYGVLARTSVPHPGPSGSWWCSGASASLSR
jgi:hypothetical protein